MSDWVVSKRKLGGFGCIEHKLQMATLPMKPEPAELCLAGRRGEVWQLRDGSFRCVEFRPSQEQLHSFPASDLPKWLRRLEVPQDPRAQVRLANNFASNSNQLAGRTLQGATNAPSNALPGSKGARDA